jgi:hypothetical protein
LEISSALLCDFAQVRDGLLFVSSGGITRMWRPELPAGMDVWLAIVVEVDAVEGRVPHEILVRIVDEDGGEAASIQGGFQLNAEVDLHVGERLLMPMPFDLRGIALQRYGAYDVSIYIDNQVRRTLNFWCYPPPT